MPASRPSYSKDRYKGRYDKLLDDSLAVVQARDFSVEELAQAAEDAFKRVPGAVMVPIERIEPNPDNPRRCTDDAAIEQMGASITERGLLQPLVVRRDPARPGYYVVIAGSRRLFAARVVHGDPDESVRERVASLPCIIKDVSDEDAFADALLENLARADLSRAETMDALIRLHRRYGWSGNQIARRTGRSQGDVSELLAIAQDPELADLVRQEKVRPSTATIIKRMPQETRTATIADLRAGTALTIDEVRRRYQAATRSAQEPSHAAAVDTPTVTRTAPVEGQEGVSNSIPPPEHHPSPGVMVEPATHRSGVSNSIPPGATTPSATSAASGIASGGSTNGERDHAAVRGVQEQLDAVGALAAMVDDGTSAGQAVLAAVQRDLGAAYDKLAAYVQRLGQRDV